MNFDRAFEIIIGEEGDYSNDRRDPGGETRYGISKRAYPNEDIKAMTLDRAKMIYKRDYWDVVKGDQLPWHWAIAVFDCAVNQGVSVATKFLQDALGVMVDGVIGPRTIKAAHAADDRKLGRFFALRALRYSNLSTFNVYGYGWFTRLFAVAINSQE
jgi:lysozyme family protein